MSELIKPEAVDGELIDRGPKRCDCGWKLPVRCRIGSSYECPECGEKYETVPADGPRRPIRPGRLMP